MLVGVVCFHFLAHAQSIKPPWEAYVLYGVEMKDKRVPVRGNKSLQEMMDHYNPEDWGSYARAVGLQYRWRTDRRFHFSSGLGFEHYVQTTQRYVDHYPDGRPTGILPLFSHRYDKWNVFATQGGHFMLFPFLELNLMMRLNFDMYTDIYWYLDATIEKRANNQDFEFYGFEAMPGLAINIWRISLGANIRAFNLRRVDKLMYGKSLSFGIPQHMEFVNPLRINFYTSYRFHSSRQR